MCTAVRGVPVCIRGNEGCWGCIPSSLFDSSCLTTRSPGNRVSLLSKVPKVRRDKSRLLSHLRPTFKCLISRDSQRYSRVDVLQPCFPGHEALLVQI